MAEQLRALASLAEDPSSTPSAVQGGETSGEPSSRVSRSCNSTSCHFGNLCTCSCTQIHANTHFSKRLKVKNKLAKIWHSLSIVMGIDGPSCDSFCKNVGLNFSRDYDINLLVFMSPKPNKKSSLYPRDCSIFVLKLW